MTVHFNRKLDIIESVEAARYIFMDEYKKSDSSSPANSSQSLSTYSSESPIVNDPIRSLRSLENLSLFPLKSTMYRCYIAPKVFYKGSCETDLDNILWESHLFHVYFDGDGKRRPRGADLDWGKPPELWIDYVRTEPNATVVDGTLYHQIFVNIMFRDSDVADGMRGRWKDGTEDVGDNGFFSSFFTTNATKSIKYLSFKKRETRIRWGVKEDMITPEEPTIEYAEVAELEDTEIVNLDELLNLPDDL